MCKVPGSTGILEFHEWKKVEPKGKPLTQLWLRFSGAPSEAMADVRVVASLGRLVGKTEKVDMAFTRAQGVARLRVSILDIEYVPDVVNWTYRGEVFPLDIEFEDAELFAVVAVGTDVDMHEGGGDAAGSGGPTEEAGQESNGSGPNGSGVEPSHTSSTPHNSLRFGSFQSSSAPPRLWSDRVDSDEAFEHSLPVLDFGPALRRMDGARAMVGRAVESQGSPVLPGPSVPSSGRQELGLALSPRGGVSGQAATTTSPPTLSQVSTPVAPGVGVGDPSLGRVALDDCLSGALRVASQPEAMASGLGWVALDPLVSAAAETAVLSSAGVRAGGEGLGQAALAHLPSGFSPDLQRSPPIRSPPTAITREEVIAFGGIPDPASQGRQMSSRIQDLSEVDDIQQRCAMRAAKIRDVEATTGYLQSHGTYPFLVATHSDGGQGAFGYWCYPMGDGSTGYLQPVWMAVM
ncbi:uncharacterized protein LOC119275214 [Triticum dicoccoides]|uniref:uncharacterized protein LOC119275214 n=1 Tax=Triticum dicoccoides TaxID=85692 RepID=UPI00188EC705|nr:uncharacterized protein LOC119275214 [Triticum dicoccoides]